MRNNTQRNKCNRRKTQVVKDEVRVKLKLFDKCLMSAFLYGIKTWENCPSQKIQGKALKRVFNSPILTTPILK